MVAADASAPDQVASAAAVCDVVLNLAGNDEVAPVASSAGALRAKCHYVDVGAVASSVQAMLGRHEDFAHAGRTCIPSIGGVPGLFGLWACHAASPLDQCDEVTVNVGLPLARWGDPRAVGQEYASGAPVLQSHAALVAMFSRPAPVLRDGQVEWVRPSANKVLVTSPDGVSFESMPLNTPEALTVPMALTAVKRVEARWGLFPSAVMDVVSAAREGVDLDDATREVFAELAQWTDDQLAPEQVPCAWGQADGQIDGNPATIRAFLPAELIPSTAAVACTAAVLVGSDPSLPRGVQPAEACFEAEQFLAEVYRLEGREVPPGPLIDIERS